MKSTILNALVGCICLLLMSTTVAIAQNQHSQERHIYLKASYSSLEGEVHIFSEVVTVRANTDAGLTFAMQDQVIAFENLLFELYPHKNFVAQMSWIDGSFTSKREAQLQRGWWLQQLGDKAQEVMLNDGIAEKNN